MKGGRFFAKKNQVDDRNPDYDRAYRRLLESFEKLTERIKRRNGKNFKKFVFYVRTCVSFSNLMCLLYREP